MINAVVNLSSKALIDGQKILAFKPIDFANLTPGATFQGFTVNVNSPVNLAWGVTRSDTLPGGLKLNPSTGLITGTVNLGLEEGNQFNGSIAITVTELLTGGQTNSDDGQFDVQVDVGAAVDTASIITSNLIVHLDMTNLETLGTTIDDQAGGDDNYEIRGTASITTLGNTRFSSNVLFNDTLTADHAYYIHRYL